MSRGTADRYSSPSAGRCPRSGVLPRHHGRPGIPLQECGLPLVPARPGPPPGLGTTLPLPAGRGRGQRRPEKGRLSVHRSGCLAPLQKRGTQPVNLPIRSLERDDLGKPGAAGGSGAGERTSAEGHLIGTPESSGAQRVASRALPAQHPSRGTFLRMSRPSRIRTRRPGWSCRCCQTRTCCWSRWRRTADPRWWLRTPRQP